MPVLRNPKHELFCQELFKGKSASEAYVIAGFKFNRGNAGALRNKQHISNRLAELLERHENSHAKSTAKAVERASVTLEGLIQEAAEIQAAALKADQHGAAVAALTAKAKLSGLWIERAQSENTNVNYAVSDEPPSEQEWTDQHVTSH
jgi:hypothetical protein